MRTLFSKRHFFTSAVSVLLSVFTVAVVAYGASVMDTASVGSGTSTPGAALSAKGEAIIEGFASVGYIFSTSTWHSSGFGTASPGTEFDVAGSALFDGVITASNYVATSTTATSTIKTSLDVATSSLQVSSYSGQVVVGATTTLPNADVANTQAVDPALTVTGVGAAASATGTLYVAGGAGNGGQIILKSSEGTHCISIIATGGANALDASGLSAATLLTTKVVACPR